MIRIQFQSNCVSPSPSLSSASSCKSCCYDHIPGSNARILLPLCPKSQTPITLSSSKSHCQKPLIRFCKASLGRSNGVGKEVNDDDRFLQASLLVSETVRHYSLWKHGFVEDTQWHSPGREHLFSYRRQENRSNASSIGRGILRRFQSPTIFLKIACDGDLLLPIVVGEFAIIQLIDALSHEQHEEIPDQFQFAENIVVKFGYEKLGEIEHIEFIISDPPHPTNKKVKMVRIMERVVNTYHARILLGKPTNDFSTSIDARPSDAINVAERLKAPIYVSKEIVRKDAIKIVHGKWKGSGKTVYDVLLDSAVEGHDPLSEEINLIQKMKTSALEERYGDAAMWRDKLAQLRMHSQ